MRAHQSWSKSYEIFHENGAAPNGSDKPTERLRYQAPRGAKKTAPTGPLQSIRAAPIKFLVGQLHNINVWTLGALNTCIKLKILHVFGIEKFIFSKI